METERKPFSSIQRPSMLARRAARASIVEDCLFIERATGSAPPTPDMAVWHVALLIAHNRLGIGHHQRIASYLTLDDALAHIQNVSKHADLNWLAWSSRPDGSSQWRGALPHPLTEYLESCTYVVTLWFGQAFDWSLIDNGGEP